MFCSLFLGFATDEQFNGELNRINPHLFSLLVGKEEYLTEVNHKGNRYLGKPLQGYPTLGQLEDLEKHLLSLLRRLVPHYHFEQTPPVLLTLT